MAPARVLLLGYLAVILVGTILLVLPVSQASGQWGRLIDMIFTATSAVCVTGLIVVDTPTHFSHFGHWVLILLVQIGGLGYMTAASLIFLALGRRMSFSDLLTLKQGLSAPNLGGVRNLLKLVVKTVLTVEAAGFILLLPVLIARDGVAKGVFSALFHSISAFNNAGFSLYSDSLESFRSNPYVVLVFSALIILGGIGFLVIYEVTTHKFRKLSLHTRLVFVTTAILLVAGMIGFWLLEGLEPGGAFNQLSAGEKFWSGLFASVTARTAGFSTIDYGGLHSATLIMTVILMVIGASPGGTGGGIKTTTFALTALASFSKLREKTRTVIFGRKLDATALITAFSLLFWATVVLAGGTTILMFIEHADPLALFFECASALGTVGLSMGITSSLSVAGKILIMLMMIIGRVGPITFGLAMFRGDEKGQVRYPIEEVLVG